MGICYSKVGQSTPEQIIRHMCDSGRYTYNPPSYGACQSSTDYINKSINASRFLDINSMFKWSPDIQAKFQVFDTATTSTAISTFAYLHHHIECVIHMYLDSDTILKAPHMLLTILTPDRDRSVDICISLMDCCVPSDTSVAHKSTFMCRVGPLWGFACTDDQGSVVEHTSLTPEVFVCRVEENIRTVVEDHIWLNCRASWECMIDH